MNPCSSWWLRFVKFLKRERFLIDFGYYWSWRYSKTFSMSLKPSGSGFRPSNVSEAVKTTIKSHSKWKYIQLTIPNSSGGALNHHHVCITLSLITWHAFFNWANKQPPEQSGFDVFKGKKRRFVEAAKE